MAAVEIEEEEGARERARGEFEFSLAATIVPVYRAARHISPLPRPS